MIRNVLDDLIDSNCVDGEDGSSLSPTVNGRIASYYYLSYKTVSALSKRLCEVYNSTEGDFVGLMRLLCDAPEYDEIPVRHNGIFLQLKFNDYRGYFESGMGTFIKYQSKSRIRLPMLWWNFTILHL